MTATVGIWFTSGILALTYLGLAAGSVRGLRIDRAGIAFVGAVGMLVVGSITVAQAVAPSSIDYEAILLLFGMMIVVGSLRISGFFEKITLFALGRITSAHRLLFATICLSGLLSAFLVNDIVCLALTPLVLIMTKRLGCAPLPHLIGLATAANIGSVGTITGNPQNMIVGVQSHISYLSFAAHLMPVAAFGLIVDFIVITWIYRKVLRSDGLIGMPAKRLEVPVLTGIGQRSPILKWLQWKSGIVTLLTLLLFLTGLPIDIIAIAAAAVLMIGRLRPDRYYGQVDWRLLLMFIGLFIVVHAFQLQVVSHCDIAHWHILIDHPIGMLALCSATLSNLVSNVPAVMLFEPVMTAISPASQQHAWLVLAMSSTLAGNLTILGSVANLIVIEQAQREGFVITFWEYLRSGIPVTILTLGIGIGWMVVVHW